MSPGGLNSSPYVAKKDLLSWYMRLADYPIEMGGAIAEPDVEELRQNNPLIYRILHQQEIHFITLNSLLSQGKRPNCRVRTIRLQRR